MDSYCGPNLSVIYNVQWMHPALSLTFMRFKNLDVALQRQNLTQTQIFFLSRPLKVIYVNTMVQKTCYQEISAPRLASRNGSMSSIQSAER